MILSFTVNLELTMPEGLTLTPEAAKDYRNMIDSALERQVSFAGLTPDHLSDEGIGVDSLAVAYSQNQTDKANGAAFDIWWNLTDIYDVATARSEQPLTETQAKAALERVAHKADAATGVSWDEIAAAIDWVTQ